MTKDKNYTKVNNDLINTKDLSLQAKALFTYLQSKPPSWKFSVERIAGQIKENKKVIAKVLKELENFGLLKRKSVKNDDNKFVGISYSILTNQELAVYPFSDKRSPVMRKQGKYSNTDYSKTDYSKKEYRVFFLEKARISFFWETLITEEDEELCVAWLTELSERWYEHKPKPISLTDRNLGRLFDALAEEGWDYCAERMGDTQLFPLKVIQEAKMDREE